MTDQTCFTQVPNWIFDHMGKWPLSVQSVVMTIARRTYGWQKTKDAISLTQFEQATGLSRQGVVNALAKAESLGIIKRTQLVNSVDYQLVNSVDYISTTSQLSVPELVNSVDTQKKERKKEEVMRADARISAAQASEESQATDQVGMFQETITNPNGMHGTPPPYAAAPPAPSKPKRERKPPAPPEVQRLYEPLYTLTNTAPRAEGGIAARTCARNLWVDFSAMPDEVEAFDPWFRKHSYPAQQAARERRSVTNPTVKQVYALWPAFKAWRDAQQRRRVDPAPPVRDEPRRPLTPDELAELRATYERARSARTA